MLAAVHDFHVCVAHASVSRGDSFGRGWFVLHVLQAGVFLMFRASGGRGDALWGKGYSLSSGWGVRLGVRSDGLAYPFLFTHAWPLSVALPDFAGFIIDRLAHAPVSRCPLSASF